MVKLSNLWICAAASFVLWQPAAHAQLKVGVVLSLTGPAASFTKSVRNAVDLFPKEIDGEPVELIIHDDRTNVVAATTIVRKYVSDDKVDVIVGPNVTPMCVAVGPIADESNTPMITPSPVPNIEGKGKWVFNTSGAVPLFAKAVVEHMKRQNVKTLGMIGYSDTWGDQWAAALKEAGAPVGIELVSDQRFGRADTTVSGQVLQLIARKPDAVMVAASYAGAAVPQLALTQRGYQGLIYQTHGIDRADFMRAAGGSAEGIFFPMGPSGVAEQLPKDYPTHAQSLGFVKLYEAKYGVNSRTPSAANMYDAAELLRAAVPIAKKKAGKPGTPAFRAALRDAIEQLKVVGAHAILAYTASNHEVTDKASVVMVTVRKGEWVLAK